MLSNFKGFTEMVASIRTIHRLDFLVVENWKENLGVAASWNEGLKRRKFYDVLMFSNDDVIYEEGALDEAVMKLHQGYEFVSIADRKNESIIDRQGFWSFVMLPKVVDKVGFFDARFYPGFFEDNDYLHRMQQAGVRMTIQKEPRVWHHDGVTSKQHFNASQYHINQRRYVEKWGGLPGQERR